MATFTPPPYFPQSSLSPPDEGRYKKFRLVIVGIGVLLVLLLGGATVGVIYMLKWLF